MAEVSRTDCTFSVITPTFNSANTLDRVFKSLSCQTFSDFEWIVVDDGSVDGTNNVIDSFSRRAMFPIVYIWQSHAHKKVAVNRGVERAKGEFVLIADSDDELPADALEALYGYWNEIPQKYRHALSGVTGLCVDEKGNLIGNRFPSRRLESTDLEVQVIHGVRGEKWGFKRRDVMKKFPYPEDIPGYVPESLVWSRIDRQYRTLYVNHVVRVYYMDRQRAKMKIRGKEAKHKCRGRFFAAKEALEQDFRLFSRSPRDLAKLSINYWRYSLHTRNGLLGTVMSLKGTVPRLIVTPMFVFGLFAFWRDRIG